MPVYEYVCSSCGQEFEELFRSMSVESRPSCPSCGGSTVERRLSVFAARQGAPSAAAEHGGPCRRCGDPNGPCAR